MDKRGRYMEEYIKEYKIIEKTEIQKEIDVMKDGFRKKYSDEISNIKAKILDRSQKLKSEIEILRKRESDLRLKISYVDLQEKRKSEILNLNVGARHALPSSCERAKFILRTGSRSMKSKNKYVFIWHKYFDKLS